ncbi:MAG: hypothetical protein BRD47_03745 [Bacteroidetes bacterium QS_8_68_28]|nr:MAG: hypothetical protein BRD47_03745 [Bacteroidetes bacterium QS_8_68_28]
MAEFERDLTASARWRGFAQRRSAGAAEDRPRAIFESDLPAVQKLMRDPEVPPHASPRCSAALAATLYRYVSPEGERRK